MLLVVSLRSRIFVLDSRLRGNDEPKNPSNQELIPVPYPCYLRETSVSFESDFVGVGVVSVDFFLPPLLPRRVFFFFGSPVVGSIGRCWVVSTLPGVWLPPFGELPAVSDDAVPEASIMAVAICSLGTE